MSTASTNRYNNTKLILGDELFNKVQSCRILQVGVGGVGVEVLKNFVMSGFGGGSGQIEVLDLDTIDLSNLNRQFLFQKQHVKRPKAVVARETALKFNPNVNITALHRNIKDLEFSVDYFKSFDFVINALDNVDARRHVNKMCLASDIPLIESGTAGYVGQVQPIKRGITECYDCQGKPVAKTFAVCTIRSTPSTAHHCISWAKSYLFPQLFGADDEADGQDLDEAEKNGENAAEIQELRKESAAIKQLRATLVEPGAAERVFEKVYNHDISRLLLMEDLWKHRTPPHPISFESLSNDSTTAVPQAETSATGAAGIKDQRVLSLKDSFEIFLSSVDRLSKRIDPASPLSFDKDDDDTLDFVVAAANLRAAVFDIESQTRFQVKEYAGNIIPAIATTNAIVAGAVVLQALHVLRSNWSSARMIWLARSSTKILSHTVLSTPNPYCSICKVVYVPLAISSNLTLGEFVSKLVIKELGWDGQVTVQEGARILWESEDFEDNGGKKMSELGLTEGCFVNVLDDDEPHLPVSFSISLLPSESTETYLLASPIPLPIPLKAPPPAPPAAEEDDDDDDDIFIGTAPAPATGIKRSAGEAELDEPKAKKTIKKTKDDDGIIVLD